VSRLLVAAFVLAIAAALVAPIFYSSPWWWIAPVGLGAASLACSVIELVRVRRRYNRWEWRP
jgi:membrane protein YdbS with pleckstrin-like domain